MTDWSVIVKITAIEFANHRQAGLGYNLLAGTGLADPT
jgi:hypothetical protein